MGDVDVSGGAGGLEARTEELELLARRFGGVATDCLGSSTSLHGYLVDGAVTTSVVLDPSGWARFETELVGALDGLHGLSWLGLRCGALDGELRAAAAAYRAVDQLDGALHDEVLGLVRLPGAFVAAGTQLAHSHDPAAAAQAGIAADPMAADVVVNELGLPAALVAAAAALPDGHGLAVPLGTDSRGIAGRPPRRLTDVVGDLAQRNADDAHHGAIDVRIITLAGGGRRVIVDVTGTKSWSPGRTSDVTSLTTNGRALVGRNTAYEQGVLSAMHKAGVRPEDDVMLVGHSEGGMVAVTTARDAVRCGRFHVTHVVTAGSPVGRTVGELPRSVQVLALENSTDVVPHLDGVANPDRPNVTTVSSAHGDHTVDGDHSLDTAYHRVAADTQASPDASVRAFLGSADDYFRGTHVTTHTFQVVRHY
ncbi:hypothetical protein [uncultured Jatrophihabitans sp.]|uniref:PGAP1-like alpha/beta domain-containing protein n=1 Tax=uncultured Jatrophihabitans sp. TaxID=1610747 RepID=UPI0035CA3382